MTIVIFGVCIQEVGLASFHYGELVYIDQDW